MFELTWDDAKNFQLKKERGISFEQIAYLIAEGKILDVVRHPNACKYGDQMICFVEIEGYAYAVPYTWEENTLTLITAFPSRRATKKYLGKPKEE